MNIYLARYSGFCFGVRRAINLALEATGKGKQVYSLGELIHNPQYVTYLESKGIKNVCCVDDIDNAVFVIRSHGVTKEDINKISESGNEIIDATCPYVKRTHELIQNAIYEDYPVLILGDPNHPEVIGMRSYGDMRTQVVSPDDNIPPLTGKKLCIICQTTQKIGNLESLVCSVLPEVVELKVYNTICLATSQRQQSSACLAKSSDLMIVIGGKQSSNTKMLFSLCSDLTSTIHVETETELSPEMLSGIRNIGLAAGASTPEETILAVYNKIKKINGDKDLATSIEDIPLFKEESC